MEKLLKKRTIEHLFSLPNVVGIGIGFKETAKNLTNKMAIVVLVTRKVPENKLAQKQMVPKSIEGIVSDVFEVGHMSELGSAECNQNLVSDTPKIDQARKFRWRPAVGGVSIGHFRVTAGTLGAVVYDKSTGQKLLLSNNHVLANTTNGKDGRANLGDPILQPGPDDGGSVKQATIAELHRFVPLENKSFNIIDAAIASPIKQRWAVPGVLGIGTVKGSTLPRPGMPVKKSGRSTGLTHARIRAVNVLTNIKYPDDKTRTFKTQIVANAFSKGGDSGSLVVDKCNKAVGLVFAESEQATFINPIRPVLELLNVRF